MAQMKLDSEVTLMGGDQTPWNWGMANMLVARRYFKENPIIYFRHTVDGQTANVASVVKHPEVVMNQGDFTLVNRSGSTSVFSLLSVEFPLGISHKLAPNISGQRSQSVAKVLQRMRSKFPTRYEIFAPFHPGMLKHNLSAPLVGKLVVKIFQEYYSWMALLSSATLLNSYCVKRAGDVLEVVEKWATSDRSLTELFYEVQLLAFPQLVDATYRDMLLGDSFGLFKDVNQVWQDPFYVVKKDGYFLRTSAQPESYLFQIPRRDELLLWLTHNYALVSGGIPYADEVLPMSGSVHHPLFNVNFSPVSAMALAGAEFALRNIFLDLAKSANVSYDMMLPLADMYAAHWQQNGAFSVVDTYVLSGPRATSAAVKYANIEMVQY